MTVTRNSQKIRFFSTHIPRLGEQGCQVYAERPLICRLFGTTPHLACPNGKRPEVLIDARIEQQIYRFFEQTRQVLL